MSLIPSESYSFPDHFTSTVTPSRLSKKKPEPEKTPRKPKIVALPDPEPDLEPEPFVAAAPVAEPAVPEIWEPEVPEVKAPPLRTQPSPPAPNPALRRVQAPPPRIPEAPVRKIALPPTLKPKVRWNHRVAPMDPPTTHNNGNGSEETRLPAAIPPAQNVIPMKAARPVPRPVQPAAARPAMPQAPVQPPPRKPAPVTVQTRVVQPRPASLPRPAPPVVANPQTDFFEVFAEDGYDAAVKRRREMKFRRFLACEGAALLVLLPLVILDLRSM